MKKTVIIPMCLWLIFPFLTSAQENQSNQEQNSIYCAEFEVKVAEFESVTPSVILVCCGGPFSDGEIPCQVISKAKYESFSGLSEVAFDTVQNGFLLTDLIEPKKHKLSKIKTIEVIESSVTRLDNNLKITIKKGSYSIDNNGFVFLEVEFLN
ncbi:hypothetical protein [Flavobacterium sp.]|uniref:hypothetical protein n=1 Tax=Flavobacterium sp. TaxID=239 RepID=UPI002B4B7041|nr:hypothetical protein [Flavobacterium sp.]HLP63411.1 hypothetical protein [Flavobacterium sp.]